MLINKPTSSGSPAIHLPVANQRQSLVKNLNILDLIHFKHRVLAKIKTMPNNCFSDCVVTTFLAFENCCYQCQHILVNDILFLHCVYILDSNFDNLGDLFACVPINKHDPLVNQEFF